MECHSHASILWNGLRFRKEFGSESVLTGACIYFDPSPLAVGHVMYQIEGLPTYFSDKGDSKGRPRHQNQEIEDDELVYLCSLATKF